METSNLQNRIYITGFSLIVIMTVGTFGYAYITNYSIDLFTCFYMTVVTVTTIGYDEIIPVKNFPWGREFTVFLAFMGIGVLTYFVSTITAIVVGGQLKETIKTRKMEKTIEKFQDHYIICGAGSHAIHIVEELNVTKRKSVVIEINQDIINTLLLSFPKQEYLLGDASHEDNLKKAGVEAANGLFAVTNNDNDNLVICLMARRLNPKVRIISLCNSHANESKIKLAGADTVTSANYIEGMRMASEMLRPSVTHMVDKILSDKYETLRLEQIIISDDLIGKTRKDINIEQFKNTLLIAIQSGEDITFKPNDDYIIQKGDLLLVLTTPEERIALQNIK